MSLRGTLSLLVLPAIAVAWLACGDPPPADWYCGETTPGALNGNESSGENIGVSIQELMVEKSWLWPVGRRKIQVCWEDETFIREDGQYRAVVREAVKDQWEATLATLEDGTPVPDELRVEFVGWTRCSEGNTGGIRIRVADVTPQADVGTAVTGVWGGMTLNFTFEKWNGKCSSWLGIPRKTCIRTIAVHEFGHALGFSHEQDRWDTPDSCDEEADNKDTENEIYGGTWDLHSVLNYCNPEWDNDGILSEQDKRWSRIVYYPEYYPGVKCTLLEAPPEKPEVPEKSTALPRLPSKRYFP